MNLSTKIETVFIDLGNVLIDVDWNRSLAVLPSSVNKMNFFNQVATSSEATQYEAGEISSDQFFSLLKKRFLPDYEEAEIIRIWNLCIGKEVTGVIPVLKKCSVPIYLLSNTNIAHFNVYKDFQVLKALTGHFYSFQLGSRKPSPLIYQRALEKVAKMPERVLFIDDLDENLAEATKLGIQTASCYRDADRLLKIFTDHALIS